jgi:hypothetical protein
MEFNERERESNTDYEWVLHHPEVQREQQGKVVAVHRAGIVGVGANHRDALEAALRQPGCPAREAITLVFVEGWPVQGGGIAAGE